jgi:hypothetical protein
LRRTAFIDPREAAEALVGLGATTGVVSRPCGIAEYDRATISVMPALPVIPRDVTGAGDALVSGTLYGLSQSLDLRAASSLGLAAAAITVESESSAAPSLTRRPSMLALKIADEVRDALAAHRPVVALETTIVTHGMPYPANVATARSLESEIRARGAAPATIAVMGGAIQVGLSESELDSLATTKNVLKLSRNDRVLNCVN